MQLSPRLKLVCGVLLIPPVAFVGAMAFLFVRDAVKPAAVPMVAVVTPKAPARIAKPSPETVATQQVTEEKKAVFQLASLVTQEETQPADDVPEEEASPAETDVAVVATAETAAVVVQETPAPAAAPLTGYIAVSGADVPSYANRPQATLVRVTATWCGPCKQSHGPLYQYAAEGGLALSVDADQNPAFVRQYQVGSMPTYLLFREGKLVDRSSGAMHQLDQIRRFIARTENTAVAVK